MFYSAKAIRSMLAIMLVLLVYSCHSSPSSPRFNHVFLSVVDVQKSVDFYTTAFDLEVFDDIRKIKRTSADGQSESYDTRIVLLRFKEQAFNLEIGSQPLLEADNSKASFTHIGIDVLDIDAASQRLLDAGAITVRPITTVEANDIVAKTAFFNGPDGELIELMQIIKGEF